MNVALGSDRAERGIALCGSGVGVSVAASKIFGIRAAICQDLILGSAEVEHDAMNVLWLGGRVLGEDAAFKPARAFLAAASAMSPGTELVSSR